jgi:hypothetical protein
MPRCRIALETGMHSPWVSRLLSELGHEVIVANARNVRVGSKSLLKLLHRQRHIRSAYGGTCRSFHRDRVGASGRSTAASASA